MTINDDNYQLVNTRLKEKLNVTKQANRELQKEIERLQMRLKNHDLVKQKYKLLKLNYSKILIQLEKLEMTRRNETDIFKYMKSKIHKLKKDKRQLQEQVARTFGNSSRLSCKKKNSIQDDVLVQINNKQPAEKKLRMSKSSNIIKKPQHYERKKRSQERSMRKIESETVKKMINIQNLHFGIPSQNATPKEGRVFSRSLPRNNENTSPNSHIGWNSSMPLEHRKVGILMNNANDQAS